MILGPNMEFVLVHSYSYYCSLSKSPFCLTRNIPADCYSRLSVTHDGTFSTHVYIHSMLALNLRFVSLHENYSHPPDHSSRLSVVATGDPFHRCVYSIKAGSNSSQVLNPFPRTGVFKSDRFFFDMV